MMEKNGNTLAPGDKVVVTARDGSKVAKEHEKGEVLDVDIDTQLVRVKWASSTEEVEFRNLEKVP